MTILEMIMLYYLMGIVYILARLWSPIGKVWVETGLDMATENNEKLRRLRTEMPRLYEIDIQLALALLAFSWPKMMAKDVIYVTRGY